MRPQKSSQSKTGNLFQCSVCYKKFNKKEKLKEHVENVHKGKKPFHCSLCPAKFGSKEKKTLHLASNHANTGFFKENKTQNQPENQTIQLIGAIDNRREYSLPYGWKKIGHRRSELSTIRWDFYVFSPSGNHFRSTPEIKRYLEENPEVKCDLEVTNTFYPCDMKRFKPSQRHGKISHSENKFANNSLSQSVLSHFIPSGLSGFLTHMYTCLLLYPGP